MKLAPIWKRSCNRHNQYSENRSDEEWYLADARKGQRATQEKAQQRPTATEEARKRKRKKAAEEAKEQGRKRKGKKRKKQKREKINKTRDRKK